VRKLEAIGQLAAGIAHEINTPTQFVGDNVRFLSEAFASLRDCIAEIQRICSQQTEVVTTASLHRCLNGADMMYLQEEIPKAIEQSLEGIQRIAKIVAAMKEFSHPGQERVPTDINRAIANTIVVATNEWKYVAHVETDLDPELTQVPILPGEFNQVILNIIVNAAHAIDERGSSGVADGRKGTIRVSTRRCGDWAEIAIADDGGGIPPEIQDRIFDPFFTTKPVGKGTGQGLAIAHDVIVSKHGGTIAVRSELGKGTTFILRLPLKLANAAEAAA
jgi:signal transduction histidine kinase